MHTMEECDLYPLLNNAPKKRKRTGQRKTGTIHYFESGGGAEPARVAAASQTTREPSKEEGLVTQAKDHVNQVQHDTQHFQAFACLLQSKQALCEIRAGMHKLFAADHPDLLAQLVKFMASEEQSDVGSDIGPNGLRGRQSGLMRLDCVNHEMLLGLHKLLATSMPAQDMDLEMEAYAGRTNQVERSQMVTTSKQNECFHASSYMPMNVVDMDVDSDNDVDETWIEADDAVLLDQFEDVGSTDKGFMSLWNHFRHESLLMVSDTALLEYLPAFIEQHRAVLCNQFRSAFIMHLLTFWELGMIDNTSIEQYVSRLDGLECSQ